MEELTEVQEVSYKEEVIQKIEQLVAEVEIVVFEVEVAEIVEPDLAEIEAAKEIFTKAEEFVEVEVFAEVEEVIEEVDIVEAVEVEDELTVVENVAVAPFKFTYASRFSESARSGDDHDDQSPTGNELEVFDKDLKEKFRVTFINLLAL